MTPIATNRLSPEVLEPVRGQLGVAHRVLDVRGLQDATGIERRDQSPFKVPVRATWASPAILSGASKAERKAAPQHISNGRYPGLSSIEQHI